MILLCSRRSRVGLNPQPWNLEYPNLNICLINKHGHMPRALEKKHLVRQTNTYEIPINVHGENQEWDVKQDV